MIRVCTICVCMIRACTICVCQVDRNRLNAQGCGWGRTASCIIWEINFRSFFRILTDHPASIQSLLTECHHINEHDRFEQLVSPVMVEHSLLGFVDLLMCLGSSPGVWELLIQSSGLSYKEIKTTSQSSHRNVWNRVQLFVFLCEVLGVQAEIATSRLLF